MKTTIHGHPPSMTSALACLLLLLPLLGPLSAVAESHGVVGEKVADFSAKVTSVRYLKDRTELNLESEGAIGELGTVQATATFKNPTTQKPASGIYKARGASFRPDGSVVDFSAHGVWHALGEHRWQVKSIGLGSDGMRTMAVGVLELKSMTMKGAVYALD